MTKHERVIRVGEHKYRFELHPEPNSPYLWCRAPSITPFRVRTEEEARRTLLFLYREEPQ